MYGKLLISVCNKVLLTPRVRLADGHRLRGRIFPEFTVFIPKNREYLAQLSVRSTREKNEGTKSFRGQKMAINGAKLTFGGGKKLGVQKASGGGGQNGYKGAKLTFGGEKNWEYKSSRGRKKPTRKKNQKVATFFCFYFEDTKMFVLCRGAI